MMMENLVSRNRRDQETQSNNEIIIKPLNEKQEELINSIEQNIITFVVGPAGTGKTNISVAMSLSLLFRKLTKGIIITRPFVECGESIGYLPGTLSEKMNPMLIPLYDEFKYYIGSSRLKKMIDDELIEIRPIAFMRGTTIRSKILIADESQNLTRQQLIMLLTRLGGDSRMIINGDPSQSDLQNGSGGSLNDFCARLRDLDKVGIVKFEHQHIVRHGLIQKIMERIV